MDEAAVASSQILLARGFLVLKKVAIGFTVVCLLFLGCTIAIVAMVDSSESSPKPDTASVAVDTRLAADTKAMILSGIEGNPAVLDAAVSQQGASISLVLMVAPGTSESEAKRLGENPVRMTKSLSQDSPPGKAIGRGIYNYLVGVYYPDERMVAQGAKVTFAERITW